MQPPSPRAAPPARLVAPGETSDAASPQLEIYGLTLAERLHRSLAKAGCSQILPADAATPGSLPGQGPVLLLRSDALLDHRLVQRLVESPDTLLVAARRTGRAGLPLAAHVDAGRGPEILALLQRPDAPRAQPSGLRTVTPAELAPAYMASLRKSERPYLFFPVRPEAVRQIEDHLFAAAYKGATDLVTKWVWPAPAAALTRALARRRVAPNAVTALNWGLTVLATLLFGAGWFATGLVAAWLMTFLDTVDGKLARCTLTSSRIGHVLDHGLDLLHPPFWWLAWGLGLAPGQQLATAVVVAGYLVGRLLEGCFLWAFRIETHSWRPLDSMFRTITARRNPNLLLFSVATLGGRPDLGMQMVALWTLASLAFHGVRLVQAGLRSRRGQPIRAWDEVGPAPLRPTAWVSGDGRSTA